MQTDFELYCSDEARLRNTLRNISGNLMQALCKLDARPSATLRNLEARAQNNPLETWCTQKNHQNLSSDTKNKSSFCVNPHNKFVKTSESAHKSTRPNVTCSKPTFADLVGDFPFLCGLGTGVIVTLTCANQQPLSPSCPPESQRRC